MRPRSRLVLPVTLIALVIVTSHLVAQQMQLASRPRFLAAVPHATYVDVAGAGHMVAGDQNDTFTLHSL